MDWIFFLTVLKKVNLKYYNESNNFCIVDLVAQSVTNNNVTAFCYLVLPFYSWYANFVCHYWLDLFSTLLKYKTLLQGRFELLSLSGSFTVTEIGGVRNRTGGLSVSLAGPDGRVIGGGIAGLLTAASPIQVRPFFHISIWIACEKPMSVDPLFCWTTEQAQPTFACVIVYHKE